MYCTWYHKSTVFLPASKYSYIIVNSFCHVDKTSVVGRVGKYFYSWTFLFACCLTPRKLWDLSVLPSKNRTHYPVLKIWQLVSFSFLTFSAILQMQDAGYPCHPFQNLIVFWLEVPSTTPLSNSEIEFFHSFFRTFLLCEVNFIMTDVMAGVHLPSPS